MKRTYYSWMLLLATIAVPSCTRELPEVAQKPVETVDADAAWSEVCPGLVRIKIDELAAPLHTGVFTRGEAESGNPDIDRIAQELGATEIKRVFKDGGKFAERRRKYGLHLWYDIYFDEDVPVTRATTSLKTVPGIDVVECVYPVKSVDANKGIPAEALYKPASNGLRSSELFFNDPGLPQQWHYNNTGTVNNSVEGADINIYEFWKITTGDPSVIVAVLDGGVQFDHEDLAANMWVNELELNGQPGVDDDNNGYIDDVYGYNFTTDSGVIVPMSHGTHVAGTVAAVNDNYIGVCGIAGGDSSHHGVRVMSCQILSGNHSNIPDCDAFVYAADNGAVISQNSWETNMNMQSMSEAIKYFIDNAGRNENSTQVVGPMDGGVVICAAGNSGLNKISFPASLPQTIAVAAIGPDYLKADYSSFGPEVDVCAPGGGNYWDSNPDESRYVYSLDIDNGYKFMPGTSMACPHVSGVAALIVSHFGGIGSGFTAQECRDIIFRATRPVDQYQTNPEYEGNIGRGLIDAGLILTENPNVAPESVVNGGVSSSGLTVTFDWNVPADGNGMAVLDYEITYESRSTGLFAYKNNSYSAVYDIINTQLPGEHFSCDLTVEDYCLECKFTVVAIDRFGNRSEPEVMLLTIDPWENRIPLSTGAQEYTINGTGADNTITVDISRIIYDFDTVFGDILTFSVDNRNDDIVAVTLAGVELTIEPLAAGRAVLEVTATDLFGATNSAVITIEVVADNIPDDHPADPSDPSDSSDDDVPANQVGELSLENNPVAETLVLHCTGAESQTVTLKIYDPAGRSVVIQNTAFDNAARCSTDVSKLAPGIYSVSIVFGDSNRKNITFFKA